ncbi:gamma-tubulin complex component 5-like isoform X2 [Dreissena polymorpha]|uniref:gamma-tubulin complex component 5-like isoform X2 n=1 Tax=Dreissena polymorpha TaxID=45954 RepID=UPI002264CA04|nr:gamma-tubulin complex component 5-like isoform X2 [Dreissena polymorpha]
MARFLEKDIVKDVRRLIECVTGFQEYEDNFSICQQFVLSNFKFHRFLDVDSHKVTRQLVGLCEKLKIHSEGVKAEKLQELAKSFLDITGFEGRDEGKTDTQYSILLVLLLISESPEYGQYVPTPRQLKTEEKDDFDWGAYLKEGIELYQPSDGELSDWSDSEEDSDVPVAPVTQGQGDLSQQTHSYSQGDLVPCNIPTGGMPEWEESEGMSDSDWLSRNLVAQYWKGEELEVQMGRYKACQLNNDWEEYKARVDPLHCRQNHRMVTENILLREVVWMLQGICNLHLLDFNGHFFSPNPEIVVPTLSAEVLQEHLSQFTKYGSYIQILQNFVEESFHGKQGETCQTYQSFTTSVAAFLQQMKSQMVAIEHRLIKQEEIMTLTSVWLEVEPLMQKVAVLCMVYMRGVHQGRALRLTSQRATLLLTTLYDTLLGVDTLFDMTVVEGDTGTAIGHSYDSLEMVKLLLPIWVQTCHPYINIIDTWISHGNLSDPCAEFIIQRNNEIRSLDETYWEKSFMFHTMMADPDNAEDRLVTDYKTADWAPKFLQPVLEKIVLTGKSMEMLEGLGKLAEENLGSSSSDDLQEFKETHLFVKFLSSLQRNLGMKSSPTSEEQTRETTHDEYRVFSPEIERQMEEKGIKDDFLKMHFKNLMNTSSQSHSILEESFLRTMHSLDMDSLRPVELILQESLYPHIHRQYERVCRKLVDTMKQQYHLMEYLQSMRRFFLMESGACLSVFYTEIFEKIRRHEHWKDSTTVTWALHEAIDPYFPVEVPRLSVALETSDDPNDLQPINITNCLCLQYEIPSPVDVVINERCQEIYNQIFSFLLQIKRAKYCLDELRFYDVAKASPVISSTDQILKSLNLDTTPRASKIHRMHLLRMRLINFVNNLHNYIMTRILHSIGLDFTRDLAKACDLDQIIEVHAAYIRKIHQRCLLHKKNAFLKEAVLKVLNLALRFQREWDGGIDNISMKQIEGTETEFYRCIHFLRSFLNSVIQRGSFPHLESLAFGLENLIPR